MIQDKEEDEEKEDKEDKDWDDGKNDKEDGPKEFLKVGLNEEQNHEEEGEEEKVDREERKKKVRSRGQIPYRTRTRMRRVGEEKEGQEDG